MQPHEFGLLDTERLILQKAVDEPPTDWLEWRRLRQSVTAMAIRARNLCEDGKVLIRPDQERIDDVSRMLSLTEPRLQETMSNISTLRYDLISMRNGFTK